jgi:glycosyltransferase involved in cell wall biosynthesis
MTFDHLLDPAAFMRPDRLVRPLSWTGHIPFAFWLVTRCRPKVLVELGTDTGNSYFAFCQAVVANQLNTRCHAVDTWEGDAQSGLYTEDVYAEMKEYNDTHFGTFSQLHRSTFDSAVLEFMDETIDLLHIDGLHTYDAVRHDYETWAPKLSSSAVVLFHDTAVEGEGFGVRRFWNEVSKNRNCLEFEHANGLGVLFLGDAQPPAIAELLAADGRRAAQRLFGRLGEFLEIGWDLRDTKESLAEREERIDRLNNYALERHQAVVDRDAQIDAMNQTIAERDIQSYNVQLEHETQLETLRRTIAVQQSTIDRLNHVEIAYISLKQSKPVRFLDWLGERSRQLAIVGRLVAGLVKPLRLKSVMRRLLVGVTPAVSNGPPGPSSPKIAPAKVDIAPAFPSTRTDVPLPDDFDANFYLENNPDVELSGMDPHEHYIKHGKAEGRLAKVAAPNRTNITQTAEFDANFYMQHYPDVELSGMNPYDHYIRHGKAEGRLAKMIDPAVLGNFSELDKDRHTVLVINHEGWLTGAPIVGYNLVKWLLQKYNVVILFLAPGPLIEACRSLGAIVIGPITFPLVRSVLPPRLILKQVTHHVALRFAIANSVESRYMLEALADSFVPTISLVHEFAANILPDLDAFREAIFWSGETVFSSQITLDNVLQIYPDLGTSGRSYPIIPQGRCALPDWSHVTDESRALELARVQSKIRPPGFPAEGIVVLGIGSVHLRKGVDLFVDCAKRLRNRAPELKFRFIWIGKGYTPTTDMGYSAFIADQIRRAELEDEVAILDEVFALDEAYRQSNILLIPSRLDPLPNVAIDALAKRLPVVCFDKVTGLAGILREAGLGDACIAGYLDTDDMAAKVLALVRSQTLYSAVADLGAKIADDKFDMEAYVTRLESLLEHEGRRALQEKLDVDVILAADLDRLDYFLPPTMKRQTQTRSDSVRGYVRSWQSGVGRRKLFPGFDPSTYARKHGLATPGADPLADYLRAGRPAGTWNYPLITGEDEPRPVSARLRVALHIHVFYPELFTLILNRLMENQIRPNLLISVPSELVRGEVAGRVNSYRGRADIRVVPNRGRDIGPFLTEFGDMWRDKYHIVGHLHTKKTGDLKDPSIGAEWFTFLLENLVGGQRRMADIIIGRMAQDEKIGMVIPDDPNIIGWDSNFSLAKALPTDIELGEPCRDPVFPVGTMFWARTKALERLLQLRLQWTDYPAEPLARDGTLLHALERLFGFVVTHSGGTIIRTNVIGVSR